jgi:hypothetical protein
MAVSHRGVAPIRAGKKEKLILNRAAADELIGPDELIGRHDVALA